VSVPASFTASESSCIAAVYALLVTTLAYRTMNWTSFVEATKAAVQHYGHGASGDRLRRLLRLAAWPFFAFRPSWWNLMKAVSDNPIIILLMINLVLLMLGTFMDMSPLIVITTPIFLPVATAFGVDPVHFGVILVLNLGIGLCTPPVGTVLFVGCAVGRISVWDAIRTIWPFYGAAVFTLLLVTYIPSLSLWLPSLFH
jgi:tripartite ATP-independent transporter DctM subunit